MGCSEVLSAGAVGWSLSHTDAWRAGWACLAATVIGVLRRVRLWRRCFGVAVVFWRVLVTGRCATVVIRLGLFFGRLTLVLASSTRLAMFWPAISSRSALLMPQGPVGAPARRLGGAVVVGFPRPRASRARRSPPRSPGPRGGGHGGHGVGEAEGDLPVDPPPLSAQSGPMLRQDGDFSVEPGPLGRGRCRRAFWRRSPTAGRLRLGVQRPWWPRPDWPGSSRYPAPRRVGGIRVGHRLGDSEPEQRGAVVYCDGGQMPGPHIAVLQMRRDRAAQHIGGAA